MVIPSKRRRIPYLFLFLFFSIVLLLAWAPRSMAAKAKNAKTKDTIKQKKGQKEQKSPQIKKQGETATQKGQQKQQQRSREKLEDLSLMDDTKENRQYHAARVMKGTPLIEILEGLVQEAARLKGSEAAEVRIRDEVRDGVHFMSKKILTPIRTVRSLASASIRNAIAISKLLMAVKHAIAGNSEGHPRVGHSGPDPGDGEGVRRDLLGRRARFHRRLQQLRGRETCAAEDEPVRGQGRCRGG